MQIRDNFSRASQINGYYKLIIGWKYVLLNICIYTKSFHVTWMTSSALVEKQLKCSNPQQVFSALTEAGHKIDYFWKEATRLKKIIAILALITCSYFSEAQDFSAFKKALFVQGKDTLRYRIMYPLQYDTKKSYPLVVYLHGAGLRGNDNELQLTESGRFFLNDSIRQKYPAIVVFPQCPADSMWFNIPPGPAYDTTVAFNHKMNMLALSTPENLVKLLMDNLVQQKIADKNRIYLGGCSLGGFGTYDLVIHYPNYFAAAFPVCGQANTELYPKIAGNVPVWIFHGAKDNIINIWPDRAMIKALRQNAAKNARYTEFPEGKHNIEVNVFAEPGLFPWLFSFRR